MRCRGSNGDAGDYCRGRARRGAQARPVMKTGTPNPPPPKAKQCLLSQCQTARDDLALDINLAGERTGDQILPMLLDAGVVVIVVSGSIDAAMQASLIRAGAFDCLAKPFTLPRLQQAVAAAQATTTALAR
jgi:FixJ family two-component response regulator